MLRIVSYRKKRNFGAKTVVGKPDFDAIFLTQCLDAGFHLAIFKMALQR
jgi:hypothetical protein